MMNQHSYTQILREGMLPYPQWEMPLRWVFMQDNDPKHKSRAAKYYFEENQVNVMEWPARSPDLNSI